MDDDTDEGPDDRPDHRHEQHDHEGVATGDKRVDAALTRLDDLDGADISTHAAIYDEVHRSLAAVLDDPTAVSGG